MLRPAPEILRESLYGDGLTEVRIPVLTRVGTWPAGEHGPQGEMPGEHKRPFVLHFSETDGVLRWHWYCHGKNGSRSCGATPVRKAVEFEEWIGEKALWSWTDHSRPLVVYLG